MNYKLTNEKITVTVSSVGGELQSIRSKDGTEYLWQGDPTYWAGRAPHLFPYVGRLTGGKYKLDGQDWDLRIHGFFRFQELTVLEASDEQVVFELNSSEETKSQFPRDFRLTLTYALSGGTIRQIFKVENRDSKTLYFGYGGHPGFQVPLAEGLCFEDYVLEFGNAGTPLSVEVTPACFIGTTTTPYPLEDGRRLPLRHSLFDNDAIVLRDVDRTITLRSSKDSRGVTVQYPGMPFLGLWHAPHTEAPYVCIEPWVSLPSRQDVVEELETKGDMVSLAPGEVYENEWSITVF